MEAVVQLIADLSGYSQNAEPDTAEGAQTVEMRRQLNAELARLGALLTPMHPGVADAELASYFKLTGVETPDVDAVLADLRRLAAVKAAYVKPGAEPA